MTAFPLTDAAISIPPARWRLLPIPTEPEAHRFAIRLNSLGSLFFFEKFVLQMNRLTLHLHKPLCETLERENLRALKELPRDHFKTSCVTEGFAMWRALPFTGLDEAAMRELGYGDDWIRWMKYAHRPEIRILTVSESIGNAGKLGIDRKSTRLNSSHIQKSRMPSSA